MRLIALEQYLSERLETPMIVVRSTSGIEPGRLTEAERERLSGFRHARRKRDWLIGRDALKQVLLALGRSDDTTAIRFPDKQVSLTHAGNIAYAAGTSAAALGIGIDYEPMRELDIRIARWFLNDSESEWLAEQAESIRVTQLVRLWTAKEAAFKSHPENARMTLSDFEIGDPAGQLGSVVANGRRIEVACCALQSGYLSVAICRESA